MPPELDVHLEARDGAGEGGSVGADVGAAQGALVDGAELAHHAVEEEEVVRAHPDSRSAIHREIRSLEVRLKGLFDVIKSDPLLPFVYRKKVRFTSPGGHT